MVLTKRKNTSTASSLLLLAWAALAGGCGATRALNGVGEARPGAAEPRYEGRPLSLWVRDLEDRHELTQTRAIIALHDYGEEAVPSILAALNNADGLTRRNAVRALCTVSRPAGRPGLEALVRALKDQDARVRTEAAQSLKFMVAAVAEWEAKSVEKRSPVPGGFPPFLGNGPAIFLPDWDLMKDALPALAEALKDPDAEVRRLSARALGAAGSSAAPWVQALADRVRDENPNVRLAAALALTEVGTGEAKSAVPVSLLIEAIGERLNESSKEVIDSIGSLGPLATPAVAKLVTLLPPRNNDYRTSLSAAQALGHIGPEARDAIPALEKMAAFSGSVGYKTAAAEALQKIRGE